MQTILTSAIDTAQRAECAYTKFITPNDTGTTGGHQGGFHIHKDAWQLFFDTPGVKGANKDEWLTITWQGDFTTESRAIYYGVGTRNEYRLTRFGRSFPYLTDDNVGDLLVLCRMPGQDYRAFVLRTDEDIDDFFAALNISPANANGIISLSRQIPPEAGLEGCFHAFLDSLISGFPDTAQLSRQARDCYRAAYRVTDRMITREPDREILRWLQAEFELFQLIENDRYSQRIQQPFSTVQELIQTANTLLQRRKSRAGFSLEHHLTELFRIFGLRFDALGITEGRTRPDLIFPGTAAYHDPSFDTGKLFVLAAKTTCKDRWRQVTTEADRVSTTHLFTLQEGISKSQLQEMYESGVCLVVPKEHLTSFPAEFRDRILTLEGFIRLIQDSQQ